MVDRSDTNVRPPNVVRRISRGRVVLYRFHSRFSGLFHQCISLGLRQAACSLGILGKLNRSVLIIRERFIGLIIICLGVFIQLFREKA